MKAFIITIGDEILIGQVVDSNSAFIAKELNKIGIKVDRIWSIADTPEAIHSALDLVPEDIGLVVMTGGLGPTNDDITKKALTDWFGTKLVMNEEVLARVKGHFNQRGLEMPEVNRFQAMLPENCHILQNDMGTASGMWFEKRSTIYISMPGVPYEMKHIMETGALPRLAAMQESKILHRTVMTQGIGESSLMKMITDWEAELAVDNIKLAYLPSPGQVRLRLSLFDSANGGEGLLDRKVNELIPLIKEYVFGFDDQQLEEVVSYQLLRFGKTMTTAESCTGGYIAHLITSLSGSSGCYKGSAVTYSNQAKADILGIDPLLIETVGAVSEEVAIAMAQGAKEKFKADFAIATTGIAGPTGGTEEKPVGTVWIGIATPEKVFAQNFNMGNERKRNVRRTALQALNMLRKEIISCCCPAEKEDIFLNK